MEWLGFERLRMEWSEAACDGGRVVGAGLLRVNIRINVINQQNKRTKKINKIQLEQKVS